MNDEREHELPAIVSAEFHQLLGFNQSDFNHTDFFSHLQRITDKNFTLAGFGQSASG